MLLLVAPRLDLGLHVTPACRFATCAVLHFHSTSNLHTHTFGTSVTFFFLLPNFCWKMHAIFHLPAYGTDFFFISSLYYEWMTKSCWQDSWPLWIVSILSFLLLLLFFILYHLFFFRRIVLDGSLTLTINQFYLILLKL